jgi:ubiquinone/menaquinone biosynthesis C-methylase UbiE
MGFYSRYVLPRIIDRLMDNEQIDRERKKTLQEVAGDTLEIGFGTGLNLPHYPGSVRKLTAVDVNQGMDALARKRIRSSAIDVESRCLSGERLPLDSESCDSVVCTWTLCSIPDVEQALREVRRVLRPGGRFFFVEHGLGGEPRVQRWQHRLTPVWKIVGGGCHLDRPIDSLVARQGLALQTLETFVLPTQPRITGFTYRGIATRS